MKKITNFWKLFGISSLVALVLIPTLEYWVFPWLTGDEASIRDWLKHLYIAMFSVGIVALAVHYMYREARNRGEHD